MRKGKLSRLLCCFGILGLLVVSCAPGVAPTPTAKPPAAPAAPSPTSKPAAEQPKYGGVLTRTSHMDLPHFDGHGAANYELIYLGLTNSQLLQNDLNDVGKIAPDLAESWEVSADGKVYTFRLRSGVKWHDGKPFTAEDAAFSLEKLRFPPRFRSVSPRGPAILEGMTKAEAVDARTLKISLERPRASFIPGIASIYALIYPKHIFDKYGDLKKELVGTGPFKLKEFVPSVSFWAEKNPDYWRKGRPYLDGVKVYPIMDPQTRLGAFRTARVLMTGSGSLGVPPEQAALIRKEMADVATVINYAGITHRIMWMNHAKSPFNDVRVRRAIDLAIDRQNLITLYGGSGVIGAAMDPGGTWGIPSAEMLKRPGFRQPKDADIARAIELMNEAGYPLGFKTTLVTRMGRAFEDPAVAVRDQLMKIKIDATIRSVDPAVITKAQLDGAFDLLLWATSDAFDDPDSRFGQLYITEASRLKQGFSDERIDAWFQEQSSTTDTAKRKEIVLRMQERIMESVVNISLYWTTHHLAWWNLVKDYRIPQEHYNHKHEDVWLAK